MTGSLNSDSTIHSLLNNDTTRRHSSRDGSLGGPQDGAFAHEKHAIRIHSPTLAVRRHSPVSGEIGQLSMNTSDPLPVSEARITPQLNSWKTKDSPVGWRDLPKKGQLAVLTLARLSEPLAERSLAAYIFYQLRSFDTSLPDSTITAQGGLLTAAFAGAQFFTAIWWGRVADSPRIGRKNVLLIGLTGSVAATLGIGFSKSFGQAITWRIMAGALNGNVGVARTMISEMIEERKFQSRAFLLLPMCFNVGVIIGPILGGFLADPINSFPSTFGPGSLLGGETGVGWMVDFPYALPNLFSATFIMISVLGVFLGLDETHHQLRYRKDWGRRFAGFLGENLFGKKQRHEYVPLTTDETELQPRISTSTAVSHLDDETRQDHGHRDSEDIEQLPSTVKSRNQTVPTGKSGIRSILTSNVLLTLLTHHLLALHVSSFNALIFLFLPNPPSHTVPSSFSFRFSGGVGLSSEKVGLATAILGLIGLPVQIFAFPRINNKLGTLKSYKWFLPFSAVAYTAIPFLALAYNKPTILWSSLIFILAAQVLGRTFALPSTVILINNSSPSPAVLGTLHGVAQSVSSAARMLGPTVGGWGLGLGLRNNFVGAVWWIMACIVGLNWGLLWMIWEGNGQGGKLDA